MSENNELQDITLKVKVDTYKALANYIHNELKLTKEDIEAMIDRSMVRIMEKKTLSSDSFERSVDSQVRKAIGNLVSSGNWNLQNNINTAIERCIGEQILSTVRQQLKGLSISTTEKL